MIKRFLCTTTLFAIALGAARAAPEFKVASFSTVLTEVAAKVGGARIEVASFLPPGIDPHEYEPTPSDLRQVGGARLILTNGLRVENYTDKLQRASGGKVELFAVGDHLSGRTNDPHWWNSVANVEEAARLVRDRLSALDPAGARDFARNAARYLAGLDELQRWARRTVAELPRNRRLLVTSHDAFEYFARDYGFTVLAIEGFDSESEPSNRHVAELIDRIAEQRIKAIFVESTLNPKVTAEITRETGAKIGGVLYADGLGVGVAGTYPGMFEHNVSTIIDALK